MDIAFRVKYCNQKASTIVMTNDAMDAARKFYYGNPGDAKRYGLPIIVRWDIPLADDMEARYSIGSGDAGLVMVA